MLRSRILKNVARARSLESLQSGLVHIPQLGNWLELGKSLFDRVMENGGIRHLFGHSWEIEKLGLRNDLCEMLDYVSRRETVSHVPNCALLQPQSIAHLASAEHL